MSGIFIFKTLPLRNNLIQDGVRYQKSVNNKNLTRDKFEKSNQPSFGSAKYVVGLLKTIEEDNKSGKNGEFVVKSNLLDLKDQANQIGEDGAINGELIDGAEIREYVGNTDLPLKEALLEYCKSNLKE